MFQVVNWRAGPYARHQGKQVNSIDPDSDSLSHAHMHAHTAPQLRNMECIRGFLHCTEVADGELTHEYTKMETCTFYQYSHMQNSKTA